MATRGSDFGLLEWYFSMSTPVLAKNALMAAIHCCIATAASDGKSARINPPTAKYWIGAQANGESHCLPVSARLVGMPNWLADTGARNPKPCLSAFSLRKRASLLSLLARTSAQKR